MANISNDEYNLLSYYLNHSCGIDIPFEKKYLFETRLNDLMFEEKISSYKECIDKLLKDNGGEFTKRLIEVMTTNETSFFRDGHPFENFKNIILPELVKIRSNTFSSGFNLNIWSAGCSTGQEPYSISMIIQEFIEHGALNNAKFFILATDISSKVLSTAKRGVYTEAQVKKGLSDFYRNKFLKESGGLWHINDLLKKSITFMELNLSRSFEGQLHSFDIIFCRNVIIYFSIDLKKSIIKQFYNMLNPGGILIMGAQENLYSLSDDFISEYIDQTIIYRKKK